MKIFNLETKKHVVGWSVVVGIVINLIISKVTLKVIRDYDIPHVSFGWPISGFITRSNIPLDKIFIQNLIIWIITALIILSLVRWIGSRKQNQ